ncbi:dockerin type I domain-containing protein [bacterium]|nr:dockerin type I domain-containing protein [bacterium]
MRARSSMVFGAIAAAGGFTAAAIASVPPTVTPQTTLQASDGATSDIFGSAVAMTDATLVVGARGLDVAAVNAGGAYVFGLVDGSWIQSQKVTVADAVAGDEFGGAVAIDGVRFVIAGASATTAVGADAGRIAVFTFNGASWVESASIVPAGGGQAGGEFGTCLAISGDTIVTGAPLHDTVLRDEGLVYVHRFDSKSTSWFLEATLTAPDAGENDRFGSSVAIDGDRILVGTPRDDDRGIDGGAAWVFDRTDGSWVASAKILRDTTDWQSGFGSAVALEGDLAVVAADRDDRFATDDGAVHLYELDLEAGWLPSAVLGAPAGSSGRELGVSVAIAGDRLVAGMPVDDEAGSDVGAAITWRRVDGTWTEEAVLRPSAAEDLSLVGTSVATAANRVVAGAPLWGGTGDPLGAVLVLDLAADCDGDGRADVVAIAAGDVEDCDGNTVPDACDIAAGDADDVDGNGIPDACFFDCDGNGLDDATEIAGDPGLDLNGNDVLDSCECLEDLSADGEVDASDLGLLIAAWNTDGSIVAGSDINGDGIVNAADLGLLIGAWGPCQ